MPELLDKWLKTTTEPTTDLLSGWLASTEPEEEPTWWEEAWGKTKGFGEWLFPKGIQDLPRQYGAALQKGGMAAGEAMTWLTRLLPGNEDRKPYAEQTTAEQAWTVTQAGATIGAVTAAVGMGIDTIKGLKTYLKGTELQKGYKEVPYTEEMVAKRQAPKVKPVPTYKVGALKGKPIPGAKASILRPGVEVTRVVKPAKPEIATAALKQLSQKVQVVEMVKKTDIIDDFTIAIREALTAKTVGTQVTQTAISNAAQTIVNDVTAVIPVQFSGEFAASLINEAVNKLDSAVNILSTGMEYTAPEKEFVAPTPEVRPTVMPEIAPKIEISKELKPLADEARKAKDVDTFIDKVSQEHLMDLSDPTKHRWGRAIPQTADEVVDTIASIEKNPKGYLEDIRLSTPGTYNAIMSGGKNVTIYRAVPPTKEQLITFFEGELSKLMQYGGRRTYPFARSLGISHSQNMSDYYKFLSEELPKIKSGKSRFSGISENKLGVGDYVALDRSYVKMHGESVLVGQQKYPTYKIISKTVPKTDVIWGQADFNEWVYSPQKMRDEIGNLTDFYTQATKEIAPAELPEIAPKAELPPSIEQEVSMGGGPVTGAGLELTDKSPYEYKEKNTFQKAINNIQKSLSVYTRIKKENPKAYIKFREFKGGEELALVRAKETNEAMWGEITQGEAMAVQRAVQMPEKAPVSKLPKNLQETYTRVKDVLEDRKQQLIARGKLEVGWPQSYIAKLDKEKEKLLAQTELLTQKKAIERRQSRIKEIDELIEVLSTREFFPAGYMEKAEKQPNILSLLPEGAYRSSRLRSNFRAGKFITDIDQAIEYGLEPLDARAGMMQYLSWFELENNKWVLYEGIKSDPTLAIKPTKNNPAPEHFIESKGITDLKGYWLNPLVSDVLSEFDRIDDFGGIAKAYASIARYGKMASFHNPIIMPIYDTQQGYMAAGLRVLNPVSLTRSLKSVLTKDEYYKKALGADLFPKPVDLGPQKDMDKFVLSVARQMDKDVPNFTKFIEKATGGEWNFKGKSNTQKMLSGIKGLYNMMWETTWGLDASSRLTTVKALQAQGWPFPDAVERARFYHADYGDVPAATRRFANYFMWTPSYQLAMAKVYGNMASHPIKERGPLLRLIAAQIAIAAGVAVAGYKWQQGNKFVKDIEGTDLQDVISSPGPLYWLNKQLFRNPLNSMFWQSSVPINIIWSIERNFDGLGNRVYDPKADKEVQIGQIAKFAIERYFRPLETKRRLTDGEVSLVNRLLSLAAISKYQRTKPKEKKKEPERWWE